MISNLDRGAIRGATKTPGCLARTGQLAHNREPWLDSETGHHELFAGVHAGSRNLGFHDLRRYNGQSTPRDTGLGAKSQCRRCVRSVIGLKGHRSTSAYRVMGPCVQDENRVHV